ncbi:MAG: Flp pilus assembly protein CpaB [Thermodesulfobacteriota bacterium]
MEMLPLAAGILLTGIALAAAGKRISAVESSIRRQAHPVEIVVAAVPIAAGTEFSRETIAKKPVPASGVGKRNVPAKDFELLIGAKAKYPIDPGEPVLWTDVEEPYETDAFSSLVSVGRRALTVTVDTASSFSGMLRPGDRVDLLAEAQDSRVPSWIPDIPVISVDRHTNRLAGQADAAEAETVTLMVTPGEGIGIARASASGKLHWFLRNPADNGAVVRDRRRSNTGVSPVEVWKGGIRILTPVPQVGSPSGSPS